MTNPPEISDEKLFAAYVAGDRAAFRAIFDRHAPTLTRVLLRRVGGAEIVDDLVQETFLQVHRARRDFRNDGRLRPWLVAIALNVMRQHFRRVGRAQEVPLDEQDADAPAAAPHDPVAADRDRRLRAALRQLPEGQRTAIELHWLEGMPFPEVARVVGASPGAGKVRAHRGYATLRTLLEEAGVTK